MLTQPPKNPDHDLQRLINYRNSDAVSQSGLKQFVGVPKPKEDSAYLYEGSLLDTLLFTPWLFDHIYYVSDDDPTTFQYRLARWIKEQFENHQIDPFKISDKIILDAYLALDYQRKWTDQNKLKYRISILQALNSLIVSQGKTIINVETKIANQVIANRGVSFIQKHYQKYITGIESPWTIHVQDDIYFQHGRHHCKALLDMYLLSPDTTNLEIIPTDFKWTSYPLRDFYRQMRRLRYDFQASFYTKALQAKYPSAFVHNFEIIVYSTYDDDFMVFTLTDQDLSVGQYGMKRINVFRSGDQEIERTHHVFGFEDALRFKDFNNRQYLNHISNGNSIWF